MVELHYDDESQEEFAQREFGGTNAAAQAQGDSTLALLADCLDRLAGALDDVESYIEDGKRHEALDEPRRIIAEAQQELEGR